jgi:hypothetical protein
MKKTVDAVGNANLAALQAHMEAVARRLGQKPVVIALTDLEKKAVKIIPKPTAKITEGGYQGYRKYIDGVPAAEKAKYPYASEVSSTGELQLLINGKHTVLDIMKLMDAQAQRKSTVQGILNYLQILKLAGLVEM